MRCTALPHITANVLINDDRWGLHADCEKWLEEVCGSRTQPLTHRSASAGTRAGCQSVGGIIGSDSTCLESGWIEPIGNYEFVVYTEDRDEPGTGVDRIWVQVLDKDNVVVAVMSMERDATDNAVKLGGGNIAITH